MNTPPHENDLQAKYTGEIILLARQLESLLHRISGSDAAGIHALTEICGSQLPETIRRQLHYVATIRNQAAHEDSFAITLEEFGRFKQTVRELQNNLQALFPAAVEVESAVEDDPEADWAVERELFSRIAHKLSLWGYCPVIGAVYLLYLLLRTLFARGYLVILILLYGCAAVLGIRAWQSAMDRGLLYIAGGALGFVWLVTAVMSCRTPVKKLPAFIGFLPGVNIIYLLLRWLQELCWSKFSVALLGLTGFAVGIWCLTCGLPMYALGALVLSWALSAIAAVLWGKQSGK